MTESRLKKSLSAGGRDARSSQDQERAAPEEKFMSARERRKTWGDEWTQSALPKVPEIPGMHLIWLSTTNGYDSLDKRIRLGYVPVRAEELSNFDTYRVKAGEHAGLVACNEMILCKIPMDIYQDIMLQMHHEAPNEEADKIRVQAEQLQGARDSSGRRLGQVEGDGFGDIDSSVDIPVFHG